MTQVFSHHINVPVNDIIFVCDTVPAAIVNPKRILVCMELVWYHTVWYHTIPWSDFHTPHANYILYFAAADRDATIVIIMLQYSMVHLVLDANFANKNLYV